MIASVFASGIKIMSDSSIDLKPRTEDPSKPIPSVKAAPLRYSLAGKNHVLKYASNIDKC